MFHVKHDPDEIRWYGTFAEGRVSGAGSNKKVRNSHFERASGAGCSGPFRNSVLG